MHAVFDLTGSVVLISMQMANRNRGQNNDKKRLFVRFKRRARYIYLRIMRIDDPPERIARGAAIGILMGILPTFGIGTLFSLLFAFIFRANKAAAVIASLAVNPLTSPLFWTLSAMAGSLVMNENYSDIISKIKNGSVWGGIGHAYHVYIAGNLIVSAIFTLAAYYIVKVWVVKHRERKARKRRKQDNLSNP